MRRIILLVTVALVMAAMMVASALPAFARSAKGEFHSEYTCCQGTEIAFFALAYHGGPDEQQLKLNKKQYTCLLTDNPPGEGV